MRFIGTALMVTLWRIASSPLAQEAPASDVALQTVKVSGVRDPAMMAYDKAYDMLSKIEKVGDGKMEMAIRVVSAQSMEPIADLEISLQGDSAFEKLPLTRGGFLTVPLSKERAADNAVFITNKKKGSIRAEYFFVPKLPGETLQFADIAESIAAARRARAEVVPWYVRVLVPTIQEVRICYPDSKQAIAVGTGAVAVRPATLAQKSMLTKETVYCAAFSGKESEGARETRVTLAPGWVALFN